MALTSLDKADPLLDHLVGHAIAYYRDFVKPEKKYRAAGKNKDEVPIVAFRKECRDFATHWMGVQSAEFQRLGAVGDWRRPYLTMQPRGGVAAPARAQLGQRALERPTILLVNQHSLSDAEDFTEGYRTLGLGRVVGEPTAGWIIYTSNLTLLDGTVMRMPFIRITDSQGRDMELKPRPVDIPVQRPIGEWYSGKDVQLETAVRTLLSELDQKP